MSDIPFPRGARDLLPNEALFRNELLERMEDVFRLFGFLSIDTPSFEHIDVLKAKNAIGAENKLIYEMKDERLGLRYDNTVSLARYMAMHQGLPLPFKRYYVGKVWRRDEPQRLRYRELLQADADIVGSKSPAADAEVMAAAATILDGIGVEYSIRINDRRIMDAVLSKIGIQEDLLPNAMRAIDKLDKIGETEVASMLRALGVESGTADQAMVFIMLDGANDAKLDYVDKIAGEGTSKDLRATLKLLGAYNIRGEPTIDFSVVRGLDYYTGIVFEYKLSDEKLSVAGGGRYDNLIGVYGNKGMPAVGVSLGVDRLLEALDFSSSTEYTYANAFVATVNDNNYWYALHVAGNLRANGIPTEINLAQRNLTNQFSYASAIKTKYVIIIGDAEEKAGKVKIRNLISGDESTVSMDEAISIIKGNVNAKI